MNIAGTFFSHVKLGQQQQQQQHSAHNFAVFNEVVKHSYEHQIEMQQ